MRHARRKISIEWHARKAVLKFTQGPRRYIHQIYLSFLLNESSSCPRSPNNQKRFYNRYVMSKKRRQGQVHVPTILPHAAHHHDLSHQPPPTTSNSEASWSPSLKNFFSPDSHRIDLICGWANESRRSHIYGRPIYCDLVAASAWARRLAEVEPPLKYRPTRGWRRELKTTWAPLSRIRLAVLVLECIRSD